MMVPTPSRTNGWSSTLKTRMQLAFVIFLSSLPKDRDHGLSFRDVKRNGDTHFCPGACPARNIESRTDIFRPLTHSAKTPVRIALFLKGFGIDSAAVVTNQHAQEVAQVLNFNLDLCRFGMTQRVHDGFAADHKEL